MAGWAGLARDADPCRASRLANPLEDGSPGCSPSPAVLRAPVCRGPRHRPAGRRREGPAGYPGRVLEGTLLLSHWRGQERIFSVLFTKLLHLLDPLCTK